MDATCKAAMRTTEVLDLVEQYIVVIFQDGDFLNDFLADMPECGRGLIEIAGHALALALGF